jgi:putative ABC transport system permease protein
VIQTSGPGLGEALADKQGAFIEDHMGEAIRGGDNQVSDFGFTFHPLIGYHLADLGSGNALADSTAPNYVYVLSGIALLVLLLACFNFTNLSIGLASGRLREIGVRKVLGAGRRQLIRQFWVEAVMQSLLAFVLGLTSAELLLPVFNDLAGTALALDYRHEGAFLLALVALAGLVGILAGSYPALVLSDVQPVNVFQGKYRVGGRNALTRSLVVVQFGLSIALIAGTFAMRQQQAFMMERTLNFDAAQVVVIPTQVTPANEADGDRILDAFKDALASRPEVLRVSGSSSTFGRSSNVSIVNTEDGARHFVNLNRVDPDYLETLGFELAAGRDFSPAYGDEAAVIVNEAFVEAFAGEFGIDDPVGHTLPQAFAGIESPEIVGVVRDYHYTHVRQPIGPMVWHTSPASGIRYVLVKIAPGDLPATLAVLRQTWAETRPDEPFDFFFMDEDIERQYQNEARWGQAIGYATAFAVLIACLGLFGLVTLATNRRTKEVGIRKVMGASPRGIVYLLSKEFAVLVLAANVIAVPLAFFAMSRWLDAFAYRIDLGAGPFVLAGVLAMVVALMTVGVQALRAAFADPVEALRYE